MDALAIVLELTVTPSGYFRTRAEQIGVSPEESAALLSFKLPADRVKEIERLLQVAAERMVRMPPIGLC